MSGRLPFRAKDLRSDAKKGATGDSAQDRPLSVSALAGIIDGAIREGTPPSVRVVGEVSGFRERTHWYFDLKDADAVVQCVVFASSARRLGFTPVEGQEVIASGRVDYYAKSGKVSLIATRLQPVGAGALDIAYQKLVEELRGLGWFDAERKRALPAFPRKVAVITSRSSAAYQDVLDTARRRMPAVGIVLVDVRVQGEAAAGEIASAIRELSRRYEEERLDAIILTRGGGSKEDLWAFNDRDLAQAIASAPVPIVAAIGHETDTTIAELVADVRAATPTQAAMRLIPDGEALSEQLDRQRSRLELSVRSMIVSGERDLERVLSRPMFRRPGAVLEPARARLDRHAELLQRSARERVGQRAIRLERLAGRLDRLRPDRVAMRRERKRAERLARAEAGMSKALAHRLGSLKMRLKAHERELSAVSPVAVLRRGYSVTINANGTIVRSTSSVEDGDLIETRLADGSVRSVVRKPGSGRTAAKPGARGTPKRDQMDLFGGQA